MEKGLVLERAAFEAVAWLFGQEWKNHLEEFNVLSKANERLIAEIKLGSIRLRPPLTKIYSESVRIVFQDDTTITINDKEAGRTVDHYLDLISLIENWVKFDPVFMRIHCYNTIAPDDIEYREFITERYPILNLNAYIRLVFFGIKRQLFALNLPCASNQQFSDLYLIEQILIKLIADYNHYFGIDRMKRYGVEGTVAELRKQTYIYRLDNTTWVHDYSPWQKTTHHKNGITREVFHEEDFILPYDEDFDYEATWWLQRAVADNREDKKNRYFSNEDLEYVVKFADKVPLRRPLLMMQKYGSILPKIAKGYRFSSTKDEKVKEDAMKIPTDKEQEAIIQLYLAQLKYDPSNAPPPWPWMQSVVKHGLSHEYEKLSTTENAEKRRGLFEQEIRYQSPNTDEENIKNQLAEWKPRILRDQLESSGGRLQDPVGENGEETLQDLTKDEKAIDPRQALVDQEEQQEPHDLLHDILRDNPKLRAIIKKEEQDLTLSAAERQYKKRAIAKAKQKIGDM